MSPARKYNFSLIVFFLCVVLAFAFSYNTSVKTAISNAVANDREFLQKSNVEIIEKLSQTKSILEWDEIIDSYNDIFITVEDSEKNIIAKSEDKFSKSLDVKERSAFEYNGKAYLLSSSVFLLREFTADSHELLKFVCIEFLIAVSALLLLILAIYTLMLRPYKEFYRSIEEYEITGKLRPNKFKGYIGHVYDRFGELTKNLEHQQQNQRRIIASISHDIKTPLTSIMGYAERLKKDSIPEERRTRYLNTVYEKSLEIRELVDEFDEYLSYNMLQNVKTEPVSTNDACGLILDEYADELESMGVNLEVINKAENIQLMVDKQKMRRVLGNIISNSLKHFKENEEKKIRVDISADKENVTIKIGDSGSGVEEEKLEMIFEPLYTSDKGRKVAGLGLAICREIVESHSGRIYAEKSDLGGLEICIKLKRQTASQ